jgi:hypothetical protein
MTSGRKSVPKNIHQLQAVRSQRGCNVGDDLGVNRLGNSEEGKKRNGRGNTSEIHLNPLLKILRSASIGTVAVSFEGWRVISKWRG